jgi:hypothetical protein
MSGNEINYSLGALIVLLMFFWFICKCIGQNQYQQPCQDRFVDNTKLVYGNTPMGLSKSPNPYIRLNSTNLMEVPNSKSAYRHLFDKEMIPCGLDNIKDKEMSTMHLQKKKSESYKSEPLRGLTAHRKLQDNSRINRTPMPSY